MSWHYDHVASMCQCDVAFHVAWVQVAWWHGRVRLQCWHDDVAHEVWCGLPCDMMIWQVWPRWHCHVGLWDGRLMMWHANVASLNVTWQLSWQYMYDLLWCGLPYGHPCWWCGWWQGKVSWCRVVRWQGQVGLGASFQGSKLGHVATSNPMWTPSPLGRWKWMQIH